MPKHLGMRFLAFAVILAPASPTPPDDRPTYNRDIRPILAESCFACHGPDKAARKADLRLDIREDALKSGAFVPGQPEKSPLIERILTMNARQVMPPAKSHKKLTEKQKET